MLKFVCYFTVFSELSRGVGGGIWEGTNLGTFKNILNISLRIPKL